MYKSFINDMQVWSGTRHSGLIDEDMLLNAQQLEPEKLNKTLSLIFATQYSKYISCIDLLTGGLGNKITVESPEYEWQIEVEDDKAVEIVRAIANGSEVSTVSPGVDVGHNRAPITLILRERAYAAGAILELDNNMFRLRVMRDAGAVSDGFKYEVSVCFGPQDQSIPSEYLRPGRFVSRAGSAYEEFSNEADIVSYTTGLKFRADLTIERISVNITGSAASDVLAYGLYNPETGKKSFLWADYAIWKMTREFLMRRDYAAWSARPLTKREGAGVINLISSTGRPINIAAGIEHQIAPANVASYVTLTYNVLYNFLNTLGYNILDIKDRKFMVFTGEMGMNLIHELLFKRLGEYGSIVDTHFVTGSGQNLTLGGQFTSVKFPNGYEASFQRLPYLDDPNHNRILHPVSKKPISSYTFYFIDTALRNGKSNVMKVVKKGRELIETCIPGTTAPQGFPAGRIGSNLVDGYTLSLLSHTSQVILDPRGCGKLYMDINDL